MGLLAASLAERLKAYAETHQPCRVLVSGIPGFLLARIAEEWTSNLTLYLVGTETVQGLPDAVRQCGPDDLTSHRVHTWAALVEPSASRRVQESIRSAGAGTVREVWGGGFPWRPCELSGVRWSDVLSDWLGRVGLPAANVDASVGCLNQFLRELEGSVSDPAGLLFSVLDGITIIPATYDDLCLYMGIPRHASGATLRKRGDDTAVLEVLDEIVEKFRSDVVDEVEEELKEIATTRFGEDPQKRDAVKLALVHLASRFRRLTPEEAENPVLAWRRLFEGARQHWSVLDSETLAKLLGPGTRAISLGEYVLESGLGLQIHSVGDNAVLTRDQNVTTPALVARFEFSAELREKAIKAVAEGQPYKLFARVNRVVVLSVDLPTGDGKYSFQVPVPDEGKQRIRFWVGPEEGKERVQTKAITLWECCSGYPLIVASPTAKLRAARRRKVKNDDGLNAYEIDQEIQLPFQGHFSLHLFLFQPASELLVTLPDAGGSGQVGGLEGVSMSPCKTALLPVDLYDGAELRFEWQGTDGFSYRAMLGVEFKGEASPKDDSLTNLIVRAHRSGNPDRAINLLEELGNGGVVLDDLPLRESAKQLADVERLQHGTEAGWWPILVTSGASLSQQAPLTRIDSAHVWRSNSLALGPQANAWRAASEGLNPGDPPDEFKAYARARAELIGELAKQFRLPPDASVENTNLVRKAFIGGIQDRLVSVYLESYLRLLRGAVEEGMPEPWRWVVWGVDSVLLFEKGASHPLSQLLGPLHPITIARLFLLQRCLGDRLLKHNQSSLAQALSQIEPLALGRVLDAQLQPSPSLVFPTGDPHWVWVCRQQAASQLPDERVIAWLREAGLDPQVGPLGVDPEIVPDTLRQYLLAYPVRQTLRLRLDDCSQRTLDSLREALVDAEGAPAPLARRLPGGLDVHDVIARVDRDADGQRLTFDPELPIRWYHSLPPAGAPVDVATFPRSQTVDFVNGDRIGATSSAMPTVRQRLVEASADGRLTVGSGLGKARGEGLSAIVSEVLAAYEPHGYQAVWGTSTEPLPARGANWTLCSASQVDPRLFINYVLKNPRTALWTYRLFGVGDDSEVEFGRGHFLLARVTRTLEAGLGALLGATGVGCSVEDLLRELAQAGLTLGDEFLRTGRKAEGALGQYLVQRLLWQPAGPIAPLPHWVTGPDGTLAAAGFLLQVDPFQDVLRQVARLDRSDNATDESPGSHGDIIALTLRLCEDELWLRPVAVESKCYPLAQANIGAASQQALATAAVVDHFLEFCVHDALKPVPPYWAQPERLLLAELVHLGLRLSRGSFGGSPASWHAFEQTVLEKVLSGTFRRDEAQAIVVVHHSGATADVLAGPTPHVLVSFADAEAARKGAVPGDYRRIQESLRTLLWHECEVEGVPKSQPKGRRKPTTEATPSPKVRAKEGKRSKRPSPPAGNQLSRAYDKFEGAFADFVGNRHAVDKLRDDLVDALIKKPPHLPTAYLLTGNPSTGKTTIAKKVAGLLGVTFVSLVGTNVKSDKDLIEQVDNAFRAAKLRPKKLSAGSQGLPEFEYPPCLIFIDEIHLVKGRAQESLLTLTEPNERYVRLRDRICRFPRATFISATTRASEVDKALRTRFGNPVHLEDYMAHEISTMISLKSSAWAAWPDSVREGIAKLSRCIPREAERLANKLERKLRVSREALGPEQALERLRVEEGLDRNGLDRLCWDVLRKLAAQAGPRGKETLANILGVADERKLTEELIPALEALGLIEQVSGGQRITDKGRNYLRNESPPS